MRQVLCLSLPKETTKTVKSLYKKRGFKSVSTYVKYLIELDEELISEDVLLEDIKQARKEYKDGKYVKADSMADFI